MDVMKDTRQVQFTYSEEEAAQTCRDVLQIRKKPGLGLIRETPPLRD